MQKFRYKLHIAKKPIHHKQKVQQLCQKINQNIFDKDCQQSNRSQITSYYFNDDQKLQLIIPQVPIFFYYQFQQKLLTNVPYLQLHIQFEDSQKNRKLRSKKLCTHQFKSCNQSNIFVLYQLLQLESAESYQTPIQMNLSIKYGEDQNQYKSFESLQNLALALGERKFGVYNDHVYSVIKKTIFVNLPIRIEHSYNLQAGYLWIKISSSLKKQGNKDIQLLINGFDLNTTLVMKNQKVRKSISHSIPKDYFCAPKKIKSGECLAIMKSLASNIVYIFKSPQQVIILLQLQKCQPFNDLFVPKLFEFMNKNQQAFANLTKYKQFLARHNCPQNLPDYDEESYWDARYQLEQQQAYDWYVQWPAFKELFLQFVTPDMRILQIGSGKSNVLKQLHKEGFKKLIGSDFSWTLVNQKRNEQRYLKTGIRWQRIDLMKQWANFDVDCILQKATIDCLSNNEARTAFKNIHKSLRKDGLFFHITTAHPQIRISMLKNWDVKVYQLPKTIIPMFNQIDNSVAYFLYICCK